MSLWFSRSLPDIISVLRLKIIPTHILHFSYDSFSVVLFLLSFVACLPPCVCETGQGMCGEQRRENLWDLVLSTGASLWPHLDPFICKQQLGHVNNFTLSYFKSLYCTDVSTSWKALGLFLKLLQKHPGPLFYSLALQKALLFHGT